MNPLTENDDNTGETTTLLIRHMVCPRCIMAVRDILTRAGLSPLSVELGSAVIPGRLSAETLAHISDSLDAIGFSLIEDRRSALVEQIKTAVIDYVHSSGKSRKKTFSDLIASSLHRDYSHLSKIFSETTGTTIEQYIIAQKIERVKELIEYGDLTISEIADLLGYSSAAHLSAQFRKHTGLTPSEYKKLRSARASLDSI